MALIDAQNYVDAEFASFRSILETVQDNYLSGRPVYFGADWTHTDGNTPSIKDNTQGATTPDNMTAENAHGDTSSSVGIIILTPIPYRLRQNEFVAEEGIGVYVAIEFIYDVDGKRYWRLEHLRGTVVFPDTPWAELVE